MRRKPARAKIRVIETAPVALPQDAAEPMTPNARISDVPRVASMLPSLHVLDLNDAPREIAAPAPKKALRIPFFSDWEDQAHLRDSQSKTLSVRSRTAWDFPPKGAENMAHAARLAFKALIRSKTVLGSIPGTSQKPAPVTAPKPHGAIEGTVPRGGQSPSIAPSAPVAKPKARTLVIPQAPIVQRPLLTTARFALACGAVLIPFGIMALRSAAEDAVSGGRQAIEAFQSGADAVGRGDFPAAAAEFALANRRLTAINGRFGFIAPLLRPAAKIFPARNKIMAAPLLLDAGTDLAGGAAALTASLAQFRADATPSEKMILAGVGLHQAMPRIERAASVLSTVSSSAIPEQYRKAFETASADAPGILEALRRADTLASLIADAAGAAGTRRYLTVFQNNAELRATGGFIGSFALLDVKKGEIKNIDMPGGGSYDLQGSLKSNYAAPQPLRLINPRWQFQDANWSPDFATSAQTISWFYGKSGGPSVDGVIAINASFMEKLLEVTGPIEMPEYGKTVTSRNFFF
ncbi:MAG: DUF4012 domain-containing protein, partial [Patescibacteria group bacterium]